MNQSSENFNKNCIYTIEKKEKFENYFKEFMNDVNNFNFSLENDEKNNEYLKKFLSNNNVFEVEKRGHDGFKESRKEDINMNNNFNNKEITSIQNNINDENNIKEILSILKKPLKFYKSPFKALFEPKKISLVGKIIFNDMNKDNKL